MSITESKEATFEKRWAVLIGINDYTHFPKLHYCRQDVIELAKSFRKVLNFDEVLEIHEEAEVRPDRDSILLTLAELRDARKIGPDDLFVFCFSGHGVNEGGRDYLLPIGARPPHVKLLGIPVQGLVDLLGEFECKHIVMFLDVNREAVAGARSSAAIGVDTNGLVKKANIVTFFSCSPADRSYEIDALQHGSFTYCILQAIKEGVVTTVAELDHHLVLNVPYVNREHAKPVQLPYTVITPETSTTWPIFFNSRKLSGFTEGYVALMKKLTQLAADGDLTEEVFLSTVEFLARLRDKPDLSTKQQTRLNAVRALCAGEWTPDAFTKMWAKSPRRNLPGPKIRKPKVLQ